MAPTTSTKKASATGKATKAKKTTKNQLLGMIKFLGKIHDGKPPRDLVAKRAGYGTGSNPSFKKALQRANKKDHVDLSDAETVALTALGQTLVEETMDEDLHEMIENQSNAKMHETILNDLTAKMKDLFVLVQDGKVHERSDLAPELGYKTEKEQGFTKLLQRVKGKGYLEFIGKSSVQLSLLCFPEGRP